MFKFSLPPPTPQIKGITIKRKEGYNSPCRVIQVAELGNKGSKSKHPIEFDFFHSIQSNSKHNNQSNKIYTKSIPMQLDLNDNLIV